MSSDKPSHGSPARPPEVRERPRLLRTLHEKFVVEERYLRPRDRRNLYAASITLIAVGVVTFVLLLVAVLTGTGPALLDRPVETWFTQQRDSAATTSMIVLAVVFGPIGMPVVVLTVIVVWSLAARHAWRPLLLAGGMLLGLVVVQVLTRLVGRGRPPVNLMLFGGDTSPSFPSGHVLAACDFFLIMAFLVVSRRGGKTLAVVAFAVAAVAIATQIVSRLYLGYHWLTDTLASVSISLAILGVVVAVDTRRGVRMPGELVEGSPPSRRDRRANRGPTPGPP